MVCSYSNLYPYSNKHPDLYSYCNRDEHTGDHAGCRSSCQRADSNRNGFTDCNSICIRLQAAKAGSDCHTLYSRRAASICYPDVWGYLFFYVNPNEDSNANSNPDDDQDAYSYFDGHANFDANADCNFHAHKSDRSHVVL